MTLDEIAAIAIERAEQIRTGRPPVPRAASRADGDVALLFEMVAVLASDGWRPISELPPAPVMAELFYSKLVFDLPPWRDERRMLGFFDGHDWREMGTAHEIFERDDKPPEHYPTHWRALPLLP